MGIFDEEMKAERDRRAEAQRKVKEAEETARREAEADSQRCTWLIEEFLVFVRRQDIAPETVEFTRTSAYDVEVGLFKKRKERVHKTEHLGVLTGWVIVEGTAGSRGGKDSLDTPPTSGYMVGVDGTLYRSFGPFRHSGSLPQIIDVYDGPSYDGGGATAADRLERILKMFASRHA